MNDVVFVIVCSHHSNVQLISCYFSTYTYDVSWLQSVNPDISIESDDNISRKTATPVLVYWLFYERLEAYFEIYVDLWQKLGWKKLYNEEPRETTFLFIFQTFHIFSCINSVTRISVKVHLSHHNLIGVFRTHIIALS